MSVFKNQYLNINYLKFPCVQIPEQGFPPHIRSKHMWLNWGSHKPLGYYRAVWWSQWARQMGTLTDFCSGRYDPSFIQSNSLSYLLKFSPMKTCSCLTMPSSPMVFFTVQFSCLNKDFIHCLHLFFISKLYNWTQRLGFEM